MKRAFLILILLSGISSLEDQSDLSLEPAYFKPKKKVKELPIEQIQNTKYYETKDGKPADIFELEDNLLEDSHEYGFAFWMRFSEEQSLDDSYFLSRLTTNKKHGDQTYYGDRTLSVFLYRSEFIYATYDLDEQLKSKERPIKLRENINGNWYFICYSKKETKIIGFLVKFGAQQIERFEQYGRHVPSKYYKIIIGGSEFKYKEMKGQFANIFFDFDGPAFVDSEQDVKNMIKKHCNMPQVLLKRTTIQIIEEPKRFTPADALEMKPFECDFIITQYSVKGWFKWTNDIRVEEQIAFKIFNLRSSQLQTRTLELLQQVGGGAKSLIHFNTYSIIDDQEIITKSVNSNELVWTFASFSYDIGTLKAFGYLISPGLVQSVIFEQTQHKQVKTLFLTIGQEQQTFNGYYSHFKLNIGPNTFNENIQLDEEGASSLYLREKRISSNEEIITSRYDSIQAVYNQVYDDDQVNGQSEYSFGMWSRWIRTFPTYLRKRSEIHSIANLKRQYSQVLLELNLNQEQFMFKSLDELQFLPQSVEGTWNYLYFGYIREEMKGKALGIVNYEGSNLKTVQFEQLHDFILDQIEFYIGKHQVPAFNGEFARIQFQFGPGAFLQSSELKNISPKGLPFIEPIPRQTIQLIGAVSKSPIEEQYEFQQFQSIKEYSISGWVKYSGLERSGEQFHIITLTQRKLDEIDNQITLEIAKNDVNYLFTTYTCDQNCDKLKSKGSLFGEYWDQWTYIYFGYKYDQTYTYVEYTFTGDQFIINDVKHYYMSVFSILIGQGKGDLLPFSGSLKQWVLNIGDGAYREGGYKDEDLSVKVHFGYEAGTDHFEQAKTIKDHADILNCESKVVHFEQSDSFTLDGVYEYGYGMWIQFKHYANKITLNKPKLMGIAKFSIQSVEHLLSIVMTVGNYQFISIQEDSLVEYDTYHESNWVFLYYAYKRQSHEQGMTRGIIVDHIGIRVIEQRLLHPLLRDHLDFIVGNAGKNYPQFNGIITGVRVYLGPASLMTQDQIKQMLNKINPKPSQIFIDSVISITEGRKIYEGDNPIIIEGESNQYSIQLWFKVNTGTFLYRLTQNEEPLDDKRIGDRVFHLINTEKYLEFSTYSLEKQDVIQAKIITQCSLEKYDSNLWAFIYQTYSKIEKSMITYFKVESRICQQSISAIHAISDKMWLYLFTDYNNKVPIGQFSDIKFNLGKGSYTNEYNKLPGYIAGNRVTPKIIKEIDILNENKEVFTEVDSMSEYSISMWIKFSSTYPNRLYKKSELYQIFRMTNNREHTEGIINKGDRMLSAYVLTNSISFNSYDINDDNPNEYSLIEIDRLENRWLFIYAGYKRQLQVAKYYVFEEGQEKTKSNDNLLQNPLEDYVAVIFDKEDGVSQFNGILAQVAISLGTGSFGQSGSFLDGKLTDYMIQYQLPQELTLQYLYAQKSGIVKLEESVQATYQDIGSYSVCGWFKLDYQPLAKFQAEQSCITLARVYENEKLNDKLLQGDRTLLIQICDQQFVRFQTYTLQGITQINEHKLIEQSIEMDSPQIWHYVYMGYDDLKGEVNILMKQFDSDIVSTMNEVWHMEANFIGVLFGQEINKETFQGQLQEWSFIYGLSFEVKKYQDQLPAYNLINNNVKQQWHQQGEETSHEFDNAVNEYSIGVWTRWLTEFYDCKAVAFHNIFRLTAHKQYSDRSQFGDRVLFSYLTNKNYEFSTYDKKQKLPALNAQIPYEYIEGEWTYIYFAYKSGQIYGLVIHKEQEKAEHIILNAEHEILAYAQLVMKKAEFGFQEFKGDLFDLRVFMGANSYLDDSKKVISMINKLHLKLPNIDLKVENFDLENDYDSMQQEDKFEFTFPYEQQTKYSVDCWLHIYSSDINNIESQQGILKLTTEINQNTLLLLRKANFITFGTYSFKKKIVPLWQSQEIPTEEWIHVYFGYSDDVALAYVKSSKGIWEYRFNARHVVPKSFKMQIANFDSFEQYKGAIKNVHVSWNEPIEVPEESLLSHQ